MAARRGPFFSRTCTTTPLEGAEPRLGSPAAALSPSLGKGSMAGAAEAGGAPAGYPAAAAAARSRRRAAPPARARARSLSLSLAWVPPAADPSPPAPPFPPRRPRFSQPRPLPFSLPSLLGLSANRVGLTRLGLLRGRSPAAVGNAPARSPACLRRLETKGRAASAGSRPFCQDCPRARPLTHSFPLTHTHTHPAPGPPAWAPTPNLPDSSENRRGKRAGAVARLLPARPLPGRGPVAGALR